MLFLLPVSTDKICWSFLQPEKLFIFYFIFKKCPLSYKILVIYFFFPGLEITLLKLGLLVYPGFPKPWELEFFKEKEKTVVEGMNYNKKYLFSLF